MWERKREREREIGEENEKRERVVVSIQTIKKVKERTSRQILKITILVSFGLFFSSNPSRTLQIEIIQSKILTSSQKIAFFGWFLSLDVSDVLLRTVWQIDGQIVGEKDES